jgi:putative peptidoglycan lipid II flippase
MLAKILSVSGVTLLSRATGFVRDILLAAVLGAGALMDAFSVALRIPNHFRAIFGEGAFNQAYIPSLARIRTQAGAAAASLFANRIFTLMLIVQLGLLALALPLMPQIIGLLAPGFVADPARFALAVTLTRITFPYLLFITLVTLLAGNLNAIDRFFAATAAPILLNVSLVVALVVAFLFPTAAHAAAWGVALAGLLEWLLLMIAARRAGVGAALARPRLDDDTRQFFRTLGPAVIGSAGVQIALFADTIIASLLPRGSYAALYFAERLYQLPIGVIAIGVGTVLLPTMSRLIAAGDVPRAHLQQNRAVGLTIQLAAPCMAAFVVMPELIVAGLFQYGAFDATASRASAAVLLAYATGLPAIVLIRAIISSFHARSDTTTPMLISLAAIAINIALKLMLWQGQGAPGLAYATAAGAWINVIALYVIARKRGWTAPDGVMVQTCVIAVASAMIAGVLTFIALPALAAIFGNLAAWARLVTLAVAGLVLLALYGGILLVAMRMAGLRLRG